MFPGDTDQLSDNFGASSLQEIRLMTDDSFSLQDHLPLEPGALNTITTGVVWARATEGGAWASVELMRLADDKAQKLFDVCFEVLDGPDAPDLIFQELDQQLVVTLSNSAASNNFMEEYVEADEVNLIGYYDSLQTLPYRNEYVFEGYQIFQLKDETVTASEIYDIDKARLVFQCDVKNYRAEDGSPTTEETEDPIAQLINFNFSQDLGASIPQDMTLEAANNGIIHSLMIDEDEFASGDRSLVNHRTYYYLAIAYAYNEYLQYAPDQPSDESDIYAPSMLGQKKPYLAGRKNIKQYSVIPHKPNAELGGTIQNSEYGTLPSMTRLEGIGNGGLELEFSSETREALLTDYCLPQTTYAVDGGPVNIKVVDPLSVPEYRLCI